MLHFDDILKIDASGVPSVEDLFGSIHEAVDAGSDPLPGVSLALVKALAELTTLQRKIEALENRLESTQLYVIGLETRLVESGLRFGHPDASINPDTSIAEVSE